MIAGVEWSRLKFEKYRHAMGCFAGCHNPTGEGVESGYQVRIYKLKVMGADADLSEVGRYGICNVESAIPVGRVDLLNTAHPSAGEVFAACELGDANPIGMVKNGVFIGMGDRGSLL